MNDRKIADASSSWDGCNLPPQIETGSVVDYRTEDVVLGEWKLWEI